MSDFDNYPILKSTLDALSLGIVVVRPDTSIVFMNKMAERMVSSHAPLRILYGRLVANDKRLALDLQNAVSRCMKAQGYIPPPQPTTLAFPRSTGTGVIATIFRQPVRNHSPKNIVSNETVTIILQDPDLIPRLPGDAFAQLYSLTQAELRVAMAIIPGVTPQIAADNLGISCNTVKTHLQRIFEKTSTSRQADLVALMLRTTPPLFA